VKRAKSLRVGRIIKFHGVGDDGYSAADFESHLKCLTRHFAIVKLEELVRKASAGESLKDEVVLTFDDGLRNNHTIAYPILRQLKVPATFFVCPGLIESARWLWTHEVRARLNFIGPKRDDFVARWKAPLKSEEQFVGWMKQLSVKSRSEVEADLRVFSSGFQPASDQRKKYDLMNWDELGSLDPTLITVGSHTVHHPVLSTLEPDELSFEISESRRLLENRLGRPVEYFCYPNGSYNPVVIEQTRRVYRAAVSTDVGFVTRHSNLYCLPRIGIAQKLPLFAWRLHRPTA